MNSRQFIYQNLIIGEMLLSNFNQKKVEADLNRALNTIENMKNDINILNNTLKDKNFQINDLIH